MTELAHAVTTVLDQCLGVQAGEDVVVLTDPPKRALAEAFLAGARAVGADAVLIEMSERSSHGEEPPPPVAAALSRCRALIAPTSKSVTHTEARRAACAQGARAATMPGITEDMLVRTMRADYAEIARRSRAVARALSDAREVRVSSARGTELSLSIEGRQGVPDDGDLRAPGSFGNLPAGEGFIAPLEASAQGRVVFDGSIWPIGLLEEPLTVDVEDGYATKISGPRAHELQSLLEPHGKEAFAVAELGIGTNDAAKLTGNVLEDEKIMGTVHVAFGDNHSFGGAIRVASHQDGVVLEPTVMVDSAVLLERGRLLA
ncbi:MAG: aminopeptidase [Actinomycetota bacterium]|nr:aminopeptidase [Actinomycetota bacterium]